MGSEGVVWVTGVSGDLGGWLVKALEQNAGVKCAVIRYWEIDEPHLLRLAAKYGRLDAVFHVGGLVALDVTESDPSATVTANVQQTNRLLSSLSMLSKIAQIEPWACVVSTGHVYAKSTDRLTEESPVHPRSAYAWSKLQAEQWALRSGLPVFIPRVFSITSPKQKPSFAVPSFARAIRSGTAKLGWLGGERDFLDTRDVARALILAWEKRLIGVYNVCQGVGVEMSSIVRIFSGWRGAIITTDAEPRPDDIQRIVGDPRKFQEATGFRPEIPWEQTLRDVWEAAK